eukprot:gene12326-13599_t
MIIKEAVLLYNPVARVRLFHTASRCVKSSRSFMKNGLLGHQCNRTFETEAKSGWRTWQGTKRPMGLTAENAGKAILGGGCMAGIGALCYYGLGLSNELGAIDKARFWPEEVRSRVKSTYLYFTASLGVTAVAAYGISQSRAVYTLMNANKWLVLGGSLVAMIGTSIACQSIPYEPGFNAKHLAWIGHSAVIGAVIAPLILLGGPLVMRAAAYTAGTVAGLSLTAACAPDEKFLNWGGPLALALGGICVASIGGMFLPASSAVGAGINSIMTYGGLVVFGGFMLYDTQKIIKLAEMTTYQGRPYDPINASLGIYMDTINIFIRILIILASSNQRRK